MPTWLSGRKQCLRSDGGGSFELRCSDCVYHLCRSSSGLSCLYAYLQSTAMSPVRYHDQIDLWSKCLPQANYSKCNDQPSCNSDQQEQRQYCLRLKSNEGTIDNFRNLTDSKDTIVQILLTPSLHVCVEVWRDANLQLQNVPESTPDRDLPEPIWQALRNMYRLPSKTRSDGDVADCVLISE